MSISNSVAGFIGSNPVVKYIERFAHQYGRRIGRIVMTLIFLYLWAPIFVLTIMSFAEQGVLNFPPQELTLKWYYKFLHNEAAMSAVLTSLKIAIPVTITTVMLAILISYGVVRFEFPGKRYIQILATLPLIVPLVVTGIALILFFGLINMETGYWTVFIAHVIRTIPYATLIIISTLISFNQTLEEASMDLGADEIKTFRKVVIPNIMPGIIAGGLLAFTMSFNEFVFTFFVRDSSTETLPVYIWGHIRYGVTPEVNVISVLFVLVAGILTLIAASLTQVETITSHG